MSETPASARCPVCAATGIRNLDAEAARCDACGLLINRRTTPLAYEDGGGQAVPDAGKMAWRLKNAQMRLALIEPFLAGHEVFIDIGCGSGEMLQAAQAISRWQIGFDTNRPLIEHIRATQPVTVFEGVFDATRIDPQLLARPKLFALSHVLEHVPEPNALLAQIGAAMNPGDLLYVEVPLHTGASFRDLGYRWTLWNAEHLALYSPAALEHLARAAGLEILHRGTRIFARGSHSRKTLIRLAVRQPLAFLKALVRKGRHSVADLLIADYGCLVLRKPGART
jgi:SAM-dependent methyltransferase